MAGEGDHQGSASEVAKRTKGGRKGKLVQQVQIDDEVTNGNETEFNEAEEGSDTDNDKDWYDYRSIAKIAETVPKLTSRNYYSWSTLIKANLRVIPHAIRHLEGTYDSNHPKWNRTFDDALVGVIRSTLDTEGEHNILYLLLDISKTYLTFHQTWTKIEKSLTSEATRTSRQIALLAQLNEAKMFNADAQKLIQEIRIMQTETSLLGAPFGDDAIYAALQRCTIKHPVYKETIATVHQVSFDALATALTVCQSAMESIPAQKVDPQQASTQTAGCNKQDNDIEIDKDSPKSRPSREGSAAGYADVTDMAQGNATPLSPFPKTLPLPRLSRKFGAHSPQRVYTAGSEILKATAVGDVSISTRCGEVLLHNVLYVHNLNVNLLSTNTLTDEVARVTLDLRGGQIHLANGTLLKIAKNHERGLLELREIIEKLKGEPVVALDPNTALTCELCMQSKSMVARMGQGSGERATGPLDLIHIDLIIDSSHVTEYTCILVLVNDHSKYVHVQPLQRKGHTFVQLKRIISFLETQTDRTVKAIQSDQGTEWRTNEVLEWTMAKGIEWQTTVGYNSRQNGQVEQMNRSLGEKMQTLLIQRNLLKSFWPYAIRAAAFKMNLTPNVDGEFPYQLMFRKSPKRFIHLIPNYNPNVFWSNSARFMETQCWSDQTEWKPVDIRPPPITSTEEELADLGYTEENLFDERVQESLDEHADMKTLLGEEGCKEANPESQSTFGLMTAGLQRNEKNLNPTVQEALTGEDRSVWKEAMRKELEGLEAMGTWEITDLPHGMNTVDTHWVLKVKTDANLIPTKYKARLVARGFTQREGIDYTEIFAPVAPIQSIRGVLAVAAVWDWEVDLVDVKQAYLNSSLHHHVYLKPPVGTKVQPGKVLKLIKGLYGLKQSGREWNIELDSHLRKIGFHCMPSAPCLYSRGTGNKLTIITAYVDDILIASPSRKEIKRTKAEIMNKWGTDDNGPVKEFLGIKITRERKQGKISLDLMAYMKGMVSKWLEKPSEKSWIPLQSVTSTTGGRKCTPEWAKQYQELVGQLLWVSNTVQPDISFAVGVLARHMSEPIDSAWGAVTHLLKYLNQTSKYCLELGGVHRRHTEQPVVTYTDVNWASDPTNG
ncbi:uncharacterized protein UDID_19409 [Ustilago sp. UG-2017a]|nr:uncharacterized protein UDID_19409 [Ustilago sp. UG-2017a]